MRWQNATMLCSLVKLVTTSDAVKRVQKSSVLSCRLSPDDGERIDFQNRVLKIVIRGATTDN
jgi:hypothetical protein